jgi:hypothetical protein
MTRISIALVALAATAGVQASDLDYTFVQIDTVKADSSSTVNVGAGTGFGTDLGFGVSGSYGINDMFYVNASYGTLTLADVLDIDETTVGFGYIMEMSPETDFNFELAYIQQDFDLLGLTTDTDGYRFTWGVRSRPSDNWEVAFRASTTQLDIDSYADVNLELRYSFTDSISAGFNFGLARYLGENLDEFGASLRFAF